MVCNFVWKKYKKINYIHLKQMENISTDELTEEEAEQVKERAVAVTEKIAVVKKIAFCGEQSKKNHQINPFSNY